jgi:hypothetical protein
MLAAATDEVLAGQALDMWYRTGAATHGFLDGIYYIREDILSREPPLRSVVYPGFGAFLRNGFPAHNETWIAYRHGDHSVGHYNNDIGAFMLYAKGAPLMVDFASQYQPSTNASLLHNTLSFGVQQHELKRPAFPRGDPRDFYTGKSWVEHEFDPHTLYELATDSESDDAWGDLLGRIRRQALFSEADFTVATSKIRELELHPFYTIEESKDPELLGPFSELDRKRLDRTYAWERRIVFVKDEDLAGPNYLVVQDHPDGLEEPRPQVNYWCLADEQTIDGDRVFWRGQYHVDLDLFVAQPARPEIESRTWWHQERGPLQAEFKGGRELQIAAHLKHQPGTPGFTVVLYPRGRYETAPTFERFGDGTAVAIGIGERRDIVCAARERRIWDVGDVRVEGTAAVVKRTGTYRSFVLLDAGTIRHGDVTLTAEGPASVRIAEDSVVAELPEGGEARLQLSKERVGAAITVNGKARGKVGADGVVELEG